MTKCEICIHNPVCDHSRFSWENCGHFHKTRNAYNQQYSKNRYEMRKENHQCVVCGCQLDENSTSLKCNCCKIYTAYARKKHYQSKKAKGLCRRCGAKLPEGTKYSACFKCRQLDSKLHKEKKDDSRST